MISPTMISSGLIAFVVSFGEFTATQFLVSPGTTTVPVIIYTQLRSGLSPSISALSTLLVAVMFAAAVISAIATRGE
jgi:ABC-type spermidine/putrescine transport system permease subunit II